MVRNDKKSPGIKKRILTSTPSPRHDSSKNIESVGLNSVLKAERNTWLSGVVISLASIIASIVLVYNARQNSVETFVSAKNHVGKVEFPVPCSRDYQHEKFTGCIPKRCARVVMDGLVTQDDASHLLSIAKKGLALGGSSGGASILDLHSGALSQGDAFINIYRYIEKENIDLLTEEDFQVYKRVKNKIKAAIATTFDVPSDELYLTKPTFFSRMNTTPPKTVHDEYWHPHIDKEVYESFHYTSLLYLSTYDQDFQGGRFIFVDKDVNKTVEPKLGRVSFFTSGSENVHYVEKLESGVRYAITVSFTCDPKQAISDPHSS